MAIYSVILATGSYTSGRVISTEELVKNTKFYRDGKSEELTQKALDAMGTRYRMWAHENEATSDLGAIALNKCFESSILKREEIDYILVAHNTGDNGDIIPPISSVVAEKAGFKKVSFSDKTAGCQGFSYALKEADSYIRLGEANKVAVIGTEKLSSIRGNSTSSLLFGDGAGAIILGRFESDYPTGILASSTEGNPTLNKILRMCNHREEFTPVIDDPNYRLIRELEMDGYAVYEQAKIVIPDTFFKLLKKTNLNADQVKYLLKHQASEKILSKSSYEGLKRMGYNDKQVREFIEQYRKDKVPKSLHYLGNSSVATTGTLLDILLKKEVDNPDLEGLLKDLENYKIEEDDIIALLSVGAGIGWAGQLIKMNPLYWDYLKN